jgi:hypothetical protein
VWYGRCSATKHSRTSLPSEVWIGHFSGSMIGYLLDISDNKTLSFNVGVSAPARRYGRSDTAWFMDDHLDNPTPSNNK